MSIKPIRTKADHRRALSEIDRLLSAKPGTPEGDELEILVMLVDAYEREHEPIPPPDPVEAIKFRMDQLGLTRKDLEPLIGTRARVSEVLSGTRSLSLQMIRKIFARTGIPLEVLVAERARPQRHDKRARRANARTRHTSL